MAILSILRQGARVKLMKESKEIPKVLRQWLFPKEAERVMKTLEEIRQKKGKVTLYVEESQNG